MKTLSMIKFVISGSYMFSFDKHISAFKINSMLVLIYNCQS